MGKGFSSCDSPNHKGETNTWFTPEEVTKDLGSFDLDPCTMSFAPYFHATENVLFDKYECGLDKIWEGRVWLNPPYGKEIDKWLTRLYHHGNGMALVFSRTETRWAQRHLWLADGVNFLKGRISFVASDGRKSTNASNGSMLLAYGEENIEYLDKIEGTIFK